MCGRFGPEACLFRAQLVAGDDFRVFKTPSLETGAHLLKTLRLLMLPLISISWSEVPAPFPTVNTEVRSPRRGRAFGPVWSSGLCHLLPVMKPGSDFPVSCTSEVTSTRLPRSTMIVMNHHASLDHSGDYIFY